MAKVVSKALRLTVGAIAGAALGASTYLAGKQAGKKEVLVEGFEGAGDMPRPGMPTSMKLSAPVGRDAEAYHALLNDRARELRVRIAEQAYASIADDADSGSARQLQAYADTGAGDSSEKGLVSSLGDANGREDRLESDQPSEPIPYERIQDALRTSKFFDQQGDQEFTMP